MSNFGVVSTLTAPVLKGVTQPCLIQFQRSFKAYKEKVIDINRTRDEADKITPATIRNCIEPLLLSSLCTLGKIEGASKPEDASDEMVERWFHGRISSTPRDLSERVRAAIGSVTYKQCPEDPSGAALTFVVNIVKALEKHNASSVTADKELCKGLIIRMTEKLEPPELYERIKIAQECWTTEQKSSLTFFEQRIASTAGDVAEGEIARDRLRQKTGQRKKPGSIPDKNTRKRRKINGYEPKADENRNEVFARKRAKVKCLNPDCGEYHLVKHCKKTSPQRRKELLNEFFKEKEKPKSIKAIVEATRSRVTDGHDGRYRVLIADVQEVIALGDYGADANALSTRMLSDVMEKDSSIRPLSLSAPLELKMALKQDSCSQTQFSASHEVILDITIYLPDTSIPVKIRNVKFIVTDQDMDELILGRSFLHAIGFNLRNHLSEIHHDINGRCIEDLISNTTHLSSMSYKGTSYLSPDDDPIDIECVESSSFGIDSDADIEQCISDIVEDARRNGISIAGAERLKDMLRSFRDVLRIKLSSDPPAKVAPLSLKLKIGAKPF